MNESISEESHRTLKSVDSKREERPETPPLDANRRSFSWNNVRNAVDARNALISSRCVEQSTRRISDVFLSLANDSPVESPERTARKLEEYIIQVRGTSTDRSGVPRVLEENEQIEADLISSRAQSSVKALSSNSRVPSHSVKRSNSFSPSVTTREEKKLHKQLKRSSTMKFEKVEPLLETDSIPQSAELDVTSSF